MNDVGWISIHRKIQECFLWDVKPFSWGQAWIDLLLLVNHQDAKMVFDGKVITVKTGQRVTSIRKLADRWGWSRTKVTHFLTSLEEEQMITRLSDTKKTLLTIVNYEKYQNTNEEKSHRKATEKPQKSTNNNDNNENNENNNIPPLSPRGGKITWQDMIAEKNYPSELERAVTDWTNYKIEKRQGYKETGYKSLLTQIQKNYEQYGEQQVVNVIERSMSANYQGICWDWLKRSKPTNGLEAFING